MEQYNEQTSEEITLEQYNSALAIVMKFHEQLALGHSKIQAQLGTITSIKSKDPLDRKIRLVFGANDKRILDFCDDNKIFTLRELYDNYSVNDLKEYPKFGDTSIRKVKEVFRDLGLIFK